jgi:hypothetical protein
MDGVVGEWRQFRYQKFSHTAPHRGSSVAHTRDVTCLYHVSLSVVNQVPRDVSKRAERDGPGDSDGGGTHTLGTKVSNTRWCCDVCMQMEITQLTLSIIVHCLYTCTLYLLLLS